MSKPRISLDQWTALATVVDAGGYAQAAEALNKSQSAVTYAVQKIESLLNVVLFQLQGRKAVLTPTGQLLYRRAKALIDEAATLEQAAGRLSAGWEPELRLVVEILFPTQVLLEALGRFGSESPHTRIEVIESVLGGTAEALLSGKADLGISPRIPTGFFGEPLIQMRMLLVAAPEHPLHQLDRKITERDLRNYRHIVVRDSGSQRDKTPLNLEAKQRWTLSHTATALQAVRAGHGFAWVAEDRIRDDLASGALMPIPTDREQDRHLTLYLIHADREGAGPGQLRLVELLREVIMERCTQPADLHLADTPLPDA